MTEKKQLELAKKLRKEIQKDFGTKLCKEINIECANCNGQMFIGYLEWYIDILEYPRKLKNKKKK